MVHAYISIACFFFAYFFTCNYLDKLEQEHQTNQYSQIWLPWFAFSIRLQSVLFLALEAREITIAESMNQGLERAIFMLAVNVVLFACSFLILQRNKTAWFIGTICSLSPIIWVVNVLYFYKSKPSFEPIESK
ncbi:hypothetical protein SOPP22_09175 [Shewanella sp. OPT22]|nr:hypothetical protein SOPP22_09175 [Shewanella sp. OPT22]